MLQEPGHLSDEDLLLVLDGEMARSAARKAQAHLAACWVCRSRMGELETTIEHFVSHHRRTLQPELSDPSGPSALLKARLAEASALKASAFWRLPLLARTVVLSCTGLLAIMLAVRLWHRPAPAQQPAEVRVAERAVPDHRLTPGATRAISLGEVCSMRHEEVVSDVSDPLRRQVFQEYGILNPRPEDYEVDYLIAPGLGGTGDIRNLWPEPSKAAAWNAHRKDVLEERLHQMVCHGDLDLETAQQAIATDWISAYERYCHSAQYTRS